MQIISDFPQELILEISPESKSLKRYIMVPMILNLLVVSIMCYNGLVLYKLTGLLLIDGGAKNNPVLTFSLPIVALS